MTRSRNGAADHGDVHRPTTRTAILRSARRRFEERGYAATTLRAIAADAGVSAPLLLHFFGSKAQLFVAAMRSPLNADRVLPELLAGGPGEAGERIARFTVSMWDAPADRDALTCLFASAAGDARIAALLRAFLVDELFAPLARALGGDAGELRASLIATEVVGVAIARHVLRVEPLASLPADDVVRLVAPQLQHHLTAPLAGAGRAMRLRR